MSSCIAAQTAVFSHTWALPHEHLVTSGWMLFQHGRTTCLRKAHNCPSWYSHMVQSNSYYWLSCNAFDSNSLSRNSTAVVDFGYGRRNSSADGDSIVHDMPDAKIEYPDNFWCQKKIGQNCWRWYTQMVESNSSHVCWLIEYLGMFSRTCKYVIKPDQQQDMTLLNFHWFKHDTSSCSTTYSAMLLNMTATINM